VQLHDGHVELTVRERERGRGEREGGGGEGGRELLRSQDRMYAAAEPQLSLSIHRTYILTYRDSPYIDI
jgi:hypothetical protein